MLCYLNHSFFVYFLKRFLFRLFSLNIFVNLSLISWFFFLIFSNAQMKGFSVKIVQTVIFRSKGGYERWVDKVLAILDDEKVLKSGGEYDNELKLQVIIQYFYTWFEFQLFNISLHLKGSPEFLFQWQFGVASQKLPKKRGKKCNATKLGLLCMAQCLKKWGPQNAYS